MFVVKAHETTRTAPKERGGRSNPLEAQHTVVLDRGQEAACVCCHSQFKLKHWGRRGKY